MVRLCVELRFFWTSQGLTFLKGNSFLHFLSFVCRAPAPCATSWELSVPFQSACIGWLPKHSEQKNFPLVFFLFVFCFCLDSSGITLVWPPPFPCYARMWHVEPRPCDIDEASIELLRPPSPARCKRFACCVSVANALHLSQIVEQVEFPLANCERHGSKLILSTTCLLPQAFIVLPCLRK